MFRSVGGRGETYQNEIEPSAAGIDLVQPYDETLNPGETKIVDLKLKFLLPPNTFAFLTPRSSTSAQGLSVSLGTIDNSYIGPLKMIITNTSRFVRTLVKGGRYCQIVLLPQLPSISLQQLGGGQKEEQEYLFGRLLQCRKERGVRGLGENSGVSGTPPVCIFLEGNIGTGKSSLATALSNKFSNVESILEPLNLWTGKDPIIRENLLELFYKGEEITGVDFQTFIAASMQQNTLEGLKRGSKEGEQKKETDVFIIERSLYSSLKVFARIMNEDGRINEVQFKILNYLLQILWSPLPRHVKEPDFVFYLTVSPVESNLRRIRERNRGEEKKISLELIQKVNSAYQRWRREKFYPLLPKKIIDLDVTHDSLEESLSKIVDEISKYLF
jgi:deoxyadenosine/deoxycytidine kinase/dUTPase